VYYDEEVLASAAAAEVPLSEVFSAQQQHERPAPAPFVASSEDFPALTEAAVTAASKQHARGASLARAGSGVSASARADQVRLLLLPLLLRGKAGQGRVLAVLPTAFVWVRRLLEG